MYGMRKIWIILCIFILTGIYLIYDHRPQHVETTFNSVIYSIDSRFEKQTTVTFKGTLYKKLWGQNVFSGVLLVDDNMKYEVKLKKDNHYYFEVLFAENPDYLVLNSLGSIMLSNDFKMIWIQLDDINEKYNLNEGYVSGPATNMEEGNRIAKSIMEGTSP